MNWFPVTDKRFIVLGFGKSGQSTATWLKNNGAHIWVSDDTHHKKEEAINLGFQIIHDEKNIDWSKFHALVQSPGIPFAKDIAHPLATSAKSHGVSIITDANLYQKAFPNCTYIGITGTNGKSTTATLIHHILTSSHRKSTLTGNIGIPFLSTAPEKNSYVVMELSSFQLALSEPALCLNVAAWTNLTEDHINEHGSLDQYILDKSRIFSNAAFSVMTTKDPISQKIANQLDPEKVIKVTSLPEEELQNAKALKGQHNAQNAAIALAVCEKLGLTKDEIFQGFKTFSGLEHRQEVVTTLGHVTFINDSKATNADSTSHALDTFDNIYWIVGGRDKSDGIEPLYPFFRKVKHAFLIGASSERFSKDLEGHVPFTPCGTLEKAVHQAYDMAKSINSTHAIVLLSPSCASYDQFKDFEHRGKLFKSYVQQLA